MSGSNYFSHDSNARNSAKLLNVRMKHGAAGYGVYFMLLERLRAEQDYVSVKDYNMIAFDLRVDAGIVKSVVEDFGLFAFTEDGERFYSESLNRRMSMKDGVSQQRSNAAAAKWGKAGDDATQKRSERLAAARKKGTHTEEEWNEMKEFFGECVICGSKENIVKDHIVPLYQGGSDGITNLQPLCRSCNSRKGADNHDYRIDYCERNACKMPAKWVENACNKSKEKKEKESVCKEKAAVASFSPPTHTQVSDFAREEGLVIDAAAFIDYNAAKGWMMGSSPMRDWKAAARKWAASGRDRPKPREMTAAEIDALRRKRREEAHEADILRLAEERKRITGIYEGAKAGKARFVAIVKAWAENGTLAKWGLPPIDGS